MSSGSQCPVLGAQGHTGCSIDVGQKAAQGLRQSATVRQPADGASAGRQWASTRRTTVGQYPLFVVIPKDDVIPKLSFFGIFTGNFPDLEISRDSA